MPSRKRGFRSSRRKRLPKHKPRSRKHLRKASADDKIEQLKKLGELRDSGVLTEEEFAAEKQKILGS